MIILNASPRSSWLYGEHPDWEVVETFLLEEHGLASRYWQKDIQRLIKHGINVLLYDPATGSVVQFCDLQRSDNHLLALEFESDEKETVFRLKYL